MVSAAFETILEVQTLDVAMRRLRHRLVTHPARDDVAAATAAVAVVDETIGQIDEEFHGLERDLKRLADEVAGIESKRVEIDGKLYGGSVTASKELIALQDEATGLLSRQNTLEDQELEIMEQQEALTERRSAQEQERSKVDGAKLAAEQALAEAEAEIRAELIEFSSQRDELAATVSPDLLARYTELADQHDGVAVARFVDGRCDGCHMQLSAVARDQLGKAADDAVITCEECGRLLVR